MAIYLVQHGKCFSKDKDPEKSLTEKGIAEVNRIATAMKKYGVSVSCISHSGKQRARQTAAIFAAELNPEDGIRESARLKPLDDVSVFADQINNEANEMFVGHLPFMERLTSFLITGTITKPVLKFQNGGVVCLEEDTETRFWFIKWTLMPQIG